MVASSGMAALLHGLRNPTDASLLIGGDPDACAAVLGVDGAAVSVASDGRQSELVWYSPGVSARFDDLQFTLGEGPGVDALSTGSLVLEHDLTRVEPSRWAVLLPEAAALGVAAVFCFPLRIGAVRVGALTLQRAVPGPMADAAMEDALVLAAALTSVVLDGGARPGVLEEQDAGLHRAVVHQAGGMISVQAEVPVAQALVLLRAYAYRHDRSVMAVAEDVVARRLRFRDGGMGRDPSADVRG
ncbi:ANTAR domain-containing protein [Streptomyces iconiensis]|uniref:ANTAR domain-containing protein n=1 Tax=Streptomyces iconiensis TaxID=1384038 RepID=A0ABT6ZSP2_9ACTN|nr:ANTAR domain-containing protein [Streptomyces iconiensis]MDJ1131814.1 ANTAR domain-containing protein [Streptomyces iconiensis]